MNTCRKCGNTVLVPSWKTCNDCDNRTQFHPKKIPKPVYKKYIPAKERPYTRSPLDDYYEYVRNILEEARKPLEPDDFLHGVMPIKQELCWCCGMELLDEQSLYCDDICQRMYSLYPGIFGMYRKM